MGEEISNIVCFPFRCFQIQCQGSEGINEPYGSVQPHLELTALSEAPFKLKFVPSISA